MERNWAGNVAYRAAEVRRVRDERELVELVRRGGSLRALGSRHSFNDLADTAGTLVDLSLLGGAPELGEGTVRVPGGMRYGELASWLEARGLALANLASLPHISVAGAVATGTHGSGDALGGLATSVRALDILTSEGSVRRIARGDADFAGAVVSLGALGVVLALELDVEPSYRVAQRVFDAPRWDDILSDVDAVTRLGTSVSIFSTWRSVDRADLLWVKSREDVPAPAADVLARLDATPADDERHPLPGSGTEATTAQRGVLGPWCERLPHFRLEATPSAGAEIQSEYLVDRADAPRVIEAIRSIRASIAPLLLAQETRTVRADELWLSPAHGRDVVGFHFTWRRDPRAVERVLAELEPRLPASARPHWGKVFLWLGDEVRHRFPRWEDFVRLRREWDPRGMFANAYLRRLGLA